MTLRLVWDYTGPERNSFAARNGWLWHTTLWRDFSVACEDGGRDLAVFSGDDLVALSPPERAGVLWAPAVERRLPDAVRAKIWALCLRERKATVQLSPLIPGFAQAALDFLAASTLLGREDRSLTSSVVNLLLEKDVLFTAMENRHRVAISASRAKTRIGIGSKKDFATFRALYRAASGDQGRSDEELNVIRDWDPGTFLVAIAEDERGPVAAHLSLLFGMGAYYAFSASDPGRAGTAGHVLIWETIRHLKVHGFRDYELGVQYRGKLRHDDSTEKERSISLFKRGFGGREMPLIIRSPAK